MKLNNNSYIKVEYDSITSVLRDLPNVDFIYEENSNNKYYLDDGHIMVSDGVSIYGSGFPVDSTKKYYSLKQYK